jgi:hypothetical protein
VELNWHVLRWIKPWGKIVVPDASKSSEMVVTCKYILQKLSINIALVGNSECWTAHSIR